MHLNTNESLKNVFCMAVDFMLKKISAESRLPKNVLDEYLYVKKDFKSMQDVADRLFESLQNRNQMATVVNKSDNNIKLKQILCNYDPTKIIDKWNAETLYSSFRKQFKVGNPNSKRNLWLVYAKAIVSGSAFLANFNTAEQFDSFVKQFSVSKYTKAALPMILEKEVFGLGFALACDFLKELGYSEYPKPDVHIMDIFSKVGLCERDDFKTYKTVIEMAEATGQTAYAVDKVFWLIGSGRFYKHRVEIGDNKKEFIKLVNDAHII